MERPCVLIEPTHAPRARTIGLCCDISVKVVTLGMHGPITRWNGALKFPPSAPIRTLNAALRPRLSPTLIPLRSPLSTRSAQPPPPCVIRLSFIAFADYRRPLTFGIRDSRANFPLSRLFSRNARERRDVSRSPRPRRTLGRVI